MKIVVNDIAADRGSGGAYSVLKDFYDTVKQYGGEHQWVFLLADNYFENSPNIEIIGKADIKASWFKRLLFDLITGKHEINQLKPDVYVSLQNTATIGVKAQQLVYLHQSLPYQSEKNFSFFKANERKLAVYQKIIGRIFNFLIKRADMVVVQTEWMKAALQKKIGTHNQVTVIPPTIDVGPLEAVTPKTNQFFYPAAGFLYKNHSVLFDAVDILLEQGYTDFSVTCTLTATEITRVVPSQIVLLGALPREEVFEHYLTSVLVFPSYIETFGLPLMEAKLLNGIVLASDTAFSHEILDFYPNGHFFDYTSPVALANLMAQVLDQKINQAPKIATNKKIPSENSWETLLHLILQQ